MSLPPLQDHSKDDFASLEHLIRTVDSSGLTRNDAVKALLRALNDESRPKWRSFTETGGAELDEEHGTKFGREVLRRAGFTGEPAHWMSGYEYGHELFDGIGPFATEAMHFMKFGPELGFLLSEIEPFLKAKGINGFVKAQPAVIATEVSGLEEPAVELCVEVAFQRQGDSAPTSVESLGKAINAVAAVDVYPIAPDRAGDAGHWKAKVQIEATQRWTTLRRLGANPTIASMSKLMAAWCREKGVRTNFGINPSEGYLRVHVIGGNHWTPPPEKSLRRLSSEQVEQVEQVEAEQVANRSLKNE